MNVARGPDFGHARFTHLKSYGGSKNANTGAKTPMIRGQLDAEHQSSAEICHPPHTEEL